jgi:hypothetical protein
LQINLIFSLHAIENCYSDNASATQNVNANDTAELNAKLDAMFEKLNQNQAVELENLTNTLFKLIDERLVKTNKLSEEQVKEFEDAKLSSDTKFKLKVGLPLSQLTGITAEVEKEWKISKEIKADGIISSLRKLLRHEELQVTEFNQLQEPD